MEDETMLVMTRRKIEVRIAELSLRVYRNGKSSTVSSCFVFFFAFGFDVYALL